MSRHNATLHARAVTIAAGLFPDSIIDCNRAGLLIDGRVVLVRACRQVVRPYTVRAASGKLYHYRRPVMRWNMHLHGQPVTTPWRWVLVAYHGGEVRTWLVPGPAIRTLTWVGYVKTKRRNRMDQWEVTK